MRKIVIRSRLALGDIACLTAVPRELASQYPGRFSVTMDTPFPDLWQNNPHIAGHCDYGSNPDEWQDWELIDAHYDRSENYSVNQSNQRGVHLLTSYCVDVATSLGLSSLYPSQLTPDIHLSRDEWGWKSLPHSLWNCQRYWLIAAGWKDDFTVKAWSAENYQAVINYFKSRIQFVQVGALGGGHHQPELQGVLSLVGQTSVRELIQTVHSSCGILCGITSLVHLSHVPRPPWQRRPRPCVVIAGGREPRTWYGYPTHRILETVGSLPCCSDGGCWHARTVPLNDGRDDRLCERVINGQPKCMQLIRPEQVILAIEQYLDSEGIE